MKQERNATDKKVTIKSTYGLCRSITYYILCLIASISFNYHGQQLQSHKKQGNAINVGIFRYNYRKKWPIAVTGKQHRICVYESNRSRCGAKYKLIQTTDFIHFAVQKIRDDHWSPDAVCGYAKTQRLFDGEWVCTKTLYRYIDLGLLPIKNIDLPLKVSRNTKKKRTRQHKKMLGTSIEQRPRHIDERLE